jgi:uncharacterized membrane protein YcjF (UPF0283 family)
VIIATVYGLAVWYGANVALASSIAIFALIVIVAREFQRVDQRIDKIRGPERD